MHNVNNLQHPRYIILFLDPGYTTTIRENRQFCYLKSTIFFLERSINEKVLLPSNLRKGIDLVYISLVDRFSLDLNSNITTQQSSELFIVMPVAIATSHISAV